MRNLSCTERSVNLRDLEKTTKLEILEKLDMSSLSIYVSETRIVPAASKQRIRVSEMEKKSHKD